MTDQAPWRVAARPTLILRNALPGLIIAGVVGCWLWRTVPHEAVRESLAVARVGVLAAILAAWAACYVIVEVLGQGWVWRRHLLPGLAWRDATSLACGKMILSPLIPGLTKLVPIAAFWRRAKLPPARVLGAGELINLAEAVVLITLASAGILLGGAGVGAVFSIGLAAYWLFILGVLGLRRAFPRLERFNLLAPWMRTSPREAFSFLAVRALLAMASTGCIHVILRELAIELAPRQALSFAGLLLFSAFLPVSVGGYGGPQGTAVLLLAHEWNVCSPARAVSASLLWATGVLLVQVCMGVLALPRLLALLRTREAWHG